MKKFGAFMMSLITGLACIGTGLASWIFNSRVVVKETVGMTPVGGIIECYKVNGGKEESVPYAKFVNLEAAVNSSNNVVSSSSSNVNMYLTTGSFIEVKNQNLTLKGGVSLFLPYEGKKYDISTDDEVTDLHDGFIDTSTSNINKYNVSRFNFVNTKLTIAAGAQIYIGAQFRELGVSGYYSEIDLDHNSNITVNGSLYCHGYIKETNNSNVDKTERLSSNLFSNSFDTDRFIDVQSGGLFSSPLFFYDAGGMGELTGLNSKGVFPINVFDFPCVQTYLKISAGANFKAPVRLRRSSGGTSFNVRQTLTIIKPSSSNEKSLLTLKTGYVSFEYCPLTPNFTKKDASKTYIVVNGDATLGYLEITVNGTKISTADKFLPFSYKFQLIVGGSGTLRTSSYKIKFMGGSLLKVLKGGYLSVQSEIIGYKANSTQGIIDYPDSYGDGKIVVNGTLKLESKAKLGGHISTEALDGNAQIDLTSAPQANLVSTSLEGLSGTSIKIYATGDFYDADANAVVSNLLKGQVSISSDSSGKQCWADGGNLISYVLTISVDNSKNYDHPLIGYKVYKYTSKGTKSIVSTDGIYMTSGGEYIFEKGESFEVESLNRAEKTEFTKQTNSQYTFASGTKYQIKGDTEITITPGEGVLVRFSIDSESGSGGSTVKILESLTKGGTYYQIGQSSSGTAVEIPVKKDAFVRYEVKQGNAKKTILSDHYLFAGIKVISTSKNDDLTKSQGTKLATKIKDMGSFFGYVLEGSTSISTDTLITGTSTIHAYIDDR